MTSIVVSNTTTFGAMSNEMVANLRKVDEAILRLAAAVSQAAAGYSGTPGTEFETGSNFGVVPSGTAGEKGTEWRYQIDSLANAWSTFKSTAQPFVDALDNG